MSDKKTLLEVLGKDGAHAAVAFFERNCVAMTANTPIPYDGTTFEAEGIRYSHSGETAPVSAPAPSNLVQALIDAIAPPPAPTPEPTPTP
jgi:hypothetical protein